MGDWTKLDVSAVSAASWIELAWFVVIDVGGFTALGYLNQNVSPPLATTSAYVNPIIAIVLGCFLFSEPINWRMVLAIGVIVIGVCVIVSAKGETPAKMRHPLTSGHAHGRSRC